METPAFLGPLALVFLAALATAYFLHRIGQPPLIGFLVAGTLLGPHGLRLVKDIERVEDLAEIGVVLLLFTVGLELSLPNLRRLGKIVWGAGPIQLFSTIGLAAAVTFPLGVPLPRGLFAGYLVALSSTAIVLKLLIDRREMDAPHARFLVGILIFQDLAVVPMMVSLPLLAGGKGLAPGAAAAALVRTALTVAVLLFAARKLVPKLLSRVVGTKRKELFIVAVLFLVLGTALVTSWAGLSLALGAFLAGLVLSESDYGHQALADVAPFRDVFSALFFVSIGMLFDPATVLARPAPVLVGLALVLAGKSALGALPVLLFGYGSRVATIVGLSLAQIGEFSFVLLRQGQAAGLVDRDFEQAFLATAIVTMIATPLVSEWSYRVAPVLAQRSQTMRRIELSPAKAALVSQGHVVVLGFGHMGETLARVLARAKVPFRVLDLDPRRVARGQDKGVPIEYGDATNDIVLRRAGIAKARAAIVLLSDPRATAAAIRHCRSLSPRLYLLVRARYLTEIPDLSALGADEVVAEEFETSLEIAGRALRRLGFPTPWVEAETEEIRRARHDAFRRFRAPEASPEQLERALGATRIELVALGPGWRAAGQSLRELNLRAGGGAAVLAAVREGEPTVSPAGDFVFREGDQVLLLGTAEAVEKSVGMMKG
ncbi:MAG TPA: cation:proton antiporter [Thermoanaerobaculia bacterium]